MVRVKEQLISEKNVTRNPPQPVRHTTTLGRAIAHWAGSLFARLRTCSLTITVESTELLTILQPNFNLNFIHAEESASGLSGLGGLAGDP